MTAGARMTLQLRSTVALLAFGLLVVGAVASTLLPTASAVLFPRYGGALRVASRGGLQTHRPAAVRLGEPSADGVSFELVVRDDSTFLRARPCPAPGLSCELRVFERALRADEVVVARVGPGVYEVTTPAPCQPSDPLCEGSTSLRVAVAGARRELHAENLASPRVIPGALALLAIAAIGVALLRARLGFAYTRRLHAWREVTLTAEGMLQDEGGGTLGIVDSRRRLRAGEVLVSPEALPRGATYRDLPVVAAGAIAQGSHARWIAGTELRLRDARVLAALASGAVWVAASVDAFAR